MAQILTVGFLYYDGFKYILTPIGNLFGNAGGDLSGRYPNPTVARINGTSVPATPAANQVLIANSSTSSSWGLLTDAQISLTADINGAKVIPNFGAQNIITTGALNASTITISSLTPAGVVHNNGSGLLSSSLIVNTDISSSANITVSKLAPGAAGQVLLSNSTPAPTWTTISGDSVISATGAMTNAKIQGNAVAVQSLGSGQDGYVLTWVNSASHWAAEPSAGGGGGGVIWGNDLAGSSNSAQYVAAISGNGGGGGAVPLSNNAHLTSSFGSNSYIDLTSADSSFGYINLLNTLTINPGPGGGTTAINFGGATAGNSATIQFASNSSGAGSALYITGQTSSTSGDGGGAINIEAGNSGDNLGLGGSISIFSGIGTTSGGIILGWGATSSLTMINGNWAWSSDADWAVSQFALSSNQSAANMTFTTQAPYASAPVGPNQNSGSFVINFPNSVGEGSFGSLILQGNGSPYLTTNFSTGTVEMTAVNDGFEFIGHGTSGFNQTTNSAVYIGGSAGEAFNETWQWFPNITGVITSQTNTIKRTVTNYSQAGSATFTIWTGSYAAGELSYLVEARVLFKNGVSAGGGSCTLLANTAVGASATIMTPFQPTGSYQPTANPINGGVNFTEEGDGPVTFTAGTDGGGNPILQVGLGTTSTPVQWMVEITEYLC